MKKAKSLPTIFKKLIMGGTSGWKCNRVCMKKMYASYNSEFTETSYFLKNMIYKYDLSSTSLRCSLFLSLGSMCSHNSQMQDHVDGGGGEEVRREPGWDHHQARHHQQGRRQYPQEGQLQRDVVYLCWPIAPSYMSPKAITSKDAYNILKKVQPRGL